ncbi:MAG: PilZ domain-containing protein [Xanthomonadales bacterium]|nr:PilZ domain-containing protein [Xanthomonadales bacterium]
MSDPRRRNPRKRPHVALEVTDALTGEVVGRLGDLSLEGMMLIADAPVTEDALYQFVFHLPDPAGRLRRIEVGVHEAWTERASSDDRHWVGFRFIDIAAEARRDVAQWLAGPAGAGA